MIVVRKPRISFAPVRVSNLVRDRRSMAQPTTNGDAAVGAAAPMTKPEPATAALPVPELDGTWPTTWGCASWTCGACKASSRRWPCPRSAGARGELLINALRDARHKFVDARQKSRCKPVGQGEVCLPSGFSNRGVCSQEPRLAAEQFDHGFRLELTAQVPQGRVEARQRAASIATRVFVLPLLDSGD